MFTFLLFLIFIDTIILSVCSYDENPHPGFALLCSLAFIIFLVGLPVVGSDVTIGNVLWAIVTRPWEAVGVIFAYICVGILWAGLWKWRRLNNDRAAEFVKRKPYLLKEYQEAKDKGGSFTETFQRYVKYRIDMPPSVTQHKERLTNWVALWPFSMLASIGYDFFYRMFSRIVSWCSGFWLRIQVRAWSGTGIYEEPVLTPVAVAVPVAAATSGQVQA